MLQGLPEGVSAVTWGAAFAGGSSTAVLAYPPRLWALRDCIEAMSAHQWLAACDLMVREHGVRRPFVERSFRVEGGVRAFLDEHGPWRRSDGQPFPRGPHPTIKDTFKNHASRSHATLVIDAMSQFLAAEVTPDNLFRRIGMAYCHYRAAALRDPPPRGAQAKPHRPVILPLEIALLCLHGVLCGHIASQYDHRVQQHQWHRTDVTPQPAGLRERVTAGVVTPARRAHHRYWFLRSLGFRTEVATTATPFPTGSAPSIARPLWPADARATGPAPPPPHASR